MSLLILGVCVLLATFRALMQEAQAGGIPREIGPKIGKMRKEQEERIKTLLSDA